MTAFDLSVVVAIAPGHPEIEPTLRTVETSSAGLSIEVVLVGDEIGQLPVVPPHLVIRQVPSAAGSLVPVRWGEGIALAGRRSSRA